MPDGGRTRIGLSRRTAGDALQTVKRYRQVSREQLAEIAKHPQAYFNSEIIELEGFSDRVREIGIYQPRVYPSFRRTKANGFRVFWLRCEWRAGKIPVKNGQELAELKDLIARANQNGQKTVTGDGAELPVVDVERHLPSLNSNLEIRKGHHTLGMKNRKSRS